ncbi:hypothetical protein RHMOL_Rhmol09G0213100 [Rhododendron molle]|uniref:Uncharacterized protein n=1 Tax=Rhododendron molle TaxID=49168 RepID=A0ACC0MFS0_RHOML|nr:hypothetical protein RHMOL_Rhmol09G0213100 [Rhododendron molle]
MAGGSEERSLEDTPTWAVAVVCFVLVLVSIVIEHLIHLIGSGKVQFVSAYGIHQLHIFIFVPALSHVLYCITTLGLGTLKMRKWKTWEDETKTLEYRYQNDPERFRFARETSFGRRHMDFWSHSPILLWIVCFFRQFFTSVTKVDYLALRHGFVTAHLAPRSKMDFDFRKYISRSLEEDFKVVVGISPILWLFAVLFLLTNTHGWYSYFWLPFIPLIILLVVGAKLQVIITKMGLRIQERGDVVKGAPVVQPGDDLFWFNRPRLILFLIHIVLFTMGSTMKPAIFKEQVPSSKNSRQPETVTWTPFSSQVGTPLHGMSPVHLLNGYRDSSAVDNSRQTSPRKSDADMNGRCDPEIAGSHSPIHHHDDGEESRMSRWHGQVGDEIGEIGSTQREARISMSDFSFR